MTHMTEVQTKIYTVADTDPSVYRPRDGAKDTGLRIMFLLWRDGFNLNKVTFRKQWSDIHATGPNTTPHAGVSEWDFYLAAKATDNLAVLQQGLVKCRAAGVDVEATCRSVQAAIGDLGQHNINREVSSEDKRIKGDWSEGGTD